MYTLQGIYTNELVGGANLSMLMGVQAAVFAIGGATGPLIAGTLFGATGSYVLVVWLTAAGLAGAAVLMGTARGKSVSTEPAIRRRGLRFGLGDGCVVELVDELSDEISDLITCRADLLQRTALGIGQLPVDVALAGDERARVAAPHRDHHVGLRGQFSREALGASVSEIDPQFAHDLHDRRVHTAGGVGFTAGRDGVMPPSAVRSNSAALICERPALCRQTNRTVAITRPQPAERGWRRVV